MNFQKTLNMETTNLLSTPNINTNPNQPKIVNDELPMKITPKVKILLVILLGLILVNIAVLLLKPKNNPVTPQASPQASFVPIASASATTKNMSEFSKLPEYMQFEQNLKDTITVNEGLDLSNSKLNFPLLEMNVNFAP